MGHTPGPWVAIKGDVFNQDRTWGVSKYLSREQCEEIDGEDATWPSRTEVIAEVCFASNGTDEADAKLMAAAPNLLKVAKLMRDRLTELANLADACWRDWEDAYVVDDVIAEAEGRE